VDSAELADSYPPSPKWHSQTKLVVGAGMAVFLFILFLLVRGVISVAALAALIAFLLAPGVRWLHVHAKIPRWLALVITYVVVLVGTLAFGLLVAGSVLASVRELNPTELVESARVWVLERVEDLRAFTLFGIDFDLSELVDPIEENLRSNGEGAVAGDEESANGFRVSLDQIQFVFGGILRSVQTVVGIVAAVFASALVTTLVAVYLSADSRRFHAALVDNVPPGYERDSLRLVADIKQIWTGYVYGQLVNSLITGALVWLALWLVGLPGAFLMGFIMLILNMIPTIGPILAAIPGILAALIAGSDRFDMPNIVFALIVAGIYIVVVQLQANLIAPKVMGASVNLRPAVVMLGLIVGLQVGGLLGSLLAVPIIASIRDVLRYTYRKLIDRDPWEERTPASNGDAVAVPDQAADDPPSDV
jgi:predicted PurR-regulated permease PerM